MLLGIGTYTFPWAIGVPGAVPQRPMSACDLLDAAVRLQVRVVQFCDNLPLIKLSASELETFHGQVKDRGLEVELGARGLATEGLRAYLQLARRFGCNFLRLVIDSPGEEPAPEAAVARLKGILPEFEAAGVRIALENHDRFPSSTLASMVEQLGPSRVGICLDTVNSLGALEGPEVVVQNLGQFTLCLHVKDFQVRRVSHQMGFVVEGCPAGRGRLNVPWLLKSLESCPHSCNAILESWVTPGDSLSETIDRERAWAKEGVDYLRQWIRT
jgi:sugar phosphate isomerase/epimerase